MRSTFIAGVLLTSTLIGCTTTDTIDREGKLLTLAAHEAQEIKDSQQRLTRQLNFAYRQMGRGKKDEARQSLGYAAQTLRDAKPGDLNPQIRIAGWISISELSRGMEDKTTAQTACDQAVGVLRSLQPVSDRPDYVIGVAAEVQALQGKSAAAKLLEESADWIKQLQPPLMQRVAIVAICDAIFDDDDYDGGLVVLRADSDATWRSDTLAMLAEQNVETFRDANGNVVMNPAQGSRTSDWISNVGNAAVPGSIPANGGRFAPVSVTQRQVSDETSFTGGASFGKPVDFQSIFAGRVGRYENPTTVPSTQPVPPLSERK